MRITSNDSEPLVQPTQSIYDVDGATSDEDEEEDEKSPLQRQLDQEADDYDMCRDFAQEVMAELGFPLPAGFYIVAALGTTPGIPRSVVRLGFALYNNFYLCDRPSEEDIQRVRDALGFTGEPMWFMDALETYWSRVE